MFPDASAAKKHSTSPPLEDKGEEDEDEEENGDEDADADEDVRGVCVCCGYEDRIHFGRILEEL